ncbi:MAG: hypothetical protein IJA10_12240 [Lachnospiraceae bacterium]|nr:hypothetical protein [Lachnospiraceae bacterium]
MKELQEEYLFLNREGINGWEDVFRVKQSAEQRIADIDAKKKELYNEHTRYKYQYEKDGDVENLYMVDVPEFEKSEISYTESEDYDEVVVYKT